MKCDCSTYFFLYSAILIYQGMGISKYFRESLELQDKESRLYFIMFAKQIRKLLLFTAKDITVLQ